MNKLAKREKFLIAIGAIGIIAYLYFTLFLGPAFSQITLENSNIEAKTNQYNEILKLKASNVANQKKLLDAKTKYEAAIKQLPGDLRDPEISNDLNTLATKGNLIISSIGFGNVTDYVASVSKTGTSTNTASTTTSTTTASTQGSTGSAEKLKLVTVNLVVSGDGDGIISFIKSIETNNRIAEVEDVTLASKADNKNSVQASITVSYYYNYDPTSKDVINYDDLTKGNTGTSSIFN